ncbi:alpha/beta hydrolase [Angustibacter sp. Root456]|uniref:alpha/beta hydrolase n=1 Tax=Angustibacter sp. Root456 TaxID=1736539 RepID=UPI0019110532|nr:alpha/beta hydrolase [Angustibacter sp. Root456]
MSVISVERRHGAEAFDLRAVVDDDAAAHGTALLLHGFPQNASLWDGVLPGVRELGLRCVTVDQRGYSPLPQPTAIDAYRLDQLVADAVAVLDATTAGEAVLVVGHDWGAAVAWALAAYHPQRVRGLVAASVPHPGAFGAALRSDAEQKERSAYMRLLSDVERAERVLLDDDGRRLRAFFSGSTLSKDVVDGYVAPMLEPGRLRGPLAWYAAMDAQFAAVPPVRVPTVYLSADHDLAVGRRAVEECAEWVDAPYEHVALPGSHWIPDERPDAVVEAVRGLL